MRYSTSPLTEEIWSDGAQVVDRKPKEGGSLEIEVLYRLPADTTLFFALKTSDEVPNWSGISNVVEIRTRLPRLIRVTTSDRDDGSPTWSPDNTRIAYARGSTPEGFGRLNIFVVPSGGGDETWLTGEPWDDSMPSWSPTGERIAFYSGRVSGYNGTNIVNVETRELGHITTDPPADSRIAWSPDGTKIAYSGRDPGNGSGIWVVSAEGGRATRITPDPSNTYGFVLAWSPDGEMIAYSSPGDEEDGDRDIWVIPAAGGQPRRIAYYVGDEVQPTWSPDGKWIAYTRVLGGNYDIWMIAVDGGQAVRLTTDPAQDVQPAWSPDGSRIAFSSNRSGNSNIWTLQVDPLRTDER
ncbi:MAG: DPP IV N-terminal domain-containing protein [Candidatus Eisenbacteria bacterium]|uniref:DPP IV N-terminal domain-containing protein n=1 Tax=Eiseniibacteriota bacterium TaxID=2212470 RepID=A0A948RUV7_UNCEI|nr:DPP IV N-terminal domain-containing protein [Candidatus Eisenbacteria bacterium]